MKIAIIADYNNQTGIGSQNYNLYHGMQTIGIDVDIINLFSPQGFKQKPDYGICIDATLGKFKLISYIWGVLWKFPYGVSNILKNKKYDCVILGHQGLTYLYHITNKYTKTILIVDDLFPLYEYAFSFTMLIYKYLLLSGLKSAQNLVFISNFTKDDYERFYHNLYAKIWKTIPIGIEKIDITANDLDTVRKEYNLEGKRIILNVGSEDVRKNISTFLQVAEKFRDNPDLLFIRVGKPSQFSQKFIQDNSCTNILYVNGLSTQSLMALYQISRVVLSPSLLEGYGKQIFEGYLYDCFIISSDVSDVATIFAEDPNVFIVKDPCAVDEYCIYINDLLTKNHVFTSSTPIQSLVTEAEEYKVFISEL